MNFDSYLLNGRQDNLIDHRLSGFSRLAGGAFVHGR